MSERWQETIRDFDFWVDGYDDARSPGSRVAR